MSAILCLKKDRLLKVFAREVVDLLNVQPDKSLSVQTFPVVYQRHFGRQFCTENYGHSNMEQLVEAVSSVVMVSFCVR